MFSYARIGFRGLIMEGNLYKGWNILIEDNFLKNKNSDTYYIYVFGQKETFDDLVFGFTSLNYYIFDKKLVISWENEEYLIFQKIPFNEADFLERKELKGYIKSGIKYIDWYVRVIYYFDGDIEEYSFVIDLSLDPNYDMEFTHRQWVGDYKNVEYFLGRYDFEIEWFV